MKIVRNAAILGSGIFALAAGGLGLALPGSAVASPKPAAPQVVRVLTAQVTPPPSPASTSSPTAGSGDQTTPDVGTAAETATAETAGAAEAPGDTHADTGNADHACPPACDTANGETP